MISKAQGKAIPNKVAVTVHPKLSALERGMLKWAVVDPEDKVLDASVGEGLMAEYLRRNMQCEVCGVSGRMEDVRRARSRLQSCDIVYAGTGDIPWRENSFDAVFMKLEGNGADALPKTLEEARRVLKEGGQLLVGVACPPAGLLLSPFAADDGLNGGPVPRKRDMVNLLHKLHFEHLSWQRTGIATGVLIGWKRKPCLENALEDTPGS